MPFQPSIAVGDRPAIEIRPVAPAPLPDTARLEDLLAEVRNLGVRLERVHSLLRRHVHEVAVRSLENETTSIERLVCAFYGVSAQALRGKTRTAHLAWARHVACWLAHVECSLNYSEIGRWLGRDHATAEHSCAAVEAARSTEPKRAAELCHLVGVLRQTLDLEVAAVPRRD